MADGLSFPSRKLEVEFRDGTRLVPDYLANLMANIDTHTMTFQEALDAANRKMQTDYLNEVGADVIAAHFRGDL